MVKLPKIDLSLLKQLVGELEASLATAEGIKQEVSVKNNDFVVELSKAMGLATGITVEASMLVGDIQATIQSNGAPATKEDGLKNLLNILKGGKLDGTN